MDGSTFSTFTVFTDLLEKIWRKEINRKHFGFDYPSALDFVCSQWQKVSITNVYFLVYKWLLAFFYLLACIVSIVALPHTTSIENDRSKWLIYFTHWGLLLCTIQSVLGAAIVGCWFLAFQSFQLAPNAKLTAKGICFIKLYWLLNTTAIDISLVISIMYWTLVHNPVTMTVDAMNVTIHILNSVFMLGDLLISSYSIRLLHFYLPLVLASAYGVFTLIYFLSGGTDRRGLRKIYNLLDWNKPSITILVLTGVAALIILVHMSIYLIYRFRKCVAIRLNSKKSNDVCNEDYVGGMALTTT